MLLEGKTKMYKPTRIYLTERETSEIEKLYGLWDFITENFSGQISVIVWESD